MNKYFYLFVYTLIVSCNKEIVVRVPDNFCGTAYIVSSQYINNENDIVIDSNGVGYSSSKIFNKNISPRVFCKMKDITEITKNYTSVVTDYNGIEIRYATLYVPCDDEYNKTPEYWDLKERERIMTNEFRTLIEDSILDIEYLNGSVK